MDESGSPYVLAGGMKAGVVLPLKAGGSLLGALSASSAQNPVHWPEGTVRRLKLVAEIFANALARARAEQVLRRSEERLVLAARTVTDLLAELDVPSGTVHWFGDVDKNLGYDPGEFPRTVQGWRAGIHPDDRPLVMQRFNQSMTSGEPLVLDYRMRCKDGSYRNWLGRGAPIPHSGDPPTTWVGAIADVTVERRARNESKVLREELSHVGRVTALGELAAATAHELNQPLTAIRSNAQAALRLLDRSTPDLDEVRSALADIVDDNRRADQVIRRLRDLMKRGERRQEPLDVNELVRGLRPIIDSEAMGRKIPLHLDLAPDLATVLGDPVQLQQVLINLVMNALEATAPVEPREVSLKTANQADWVEVAVRDTGAGVAPAMAERIFEAFWTTKSEGMGMGLTICRSVIEAHGGRLEATANPDQGMTFQFSLPSLPGEKRPSS